MENKKNSFTIYLLMLALALIWGLSFIFTKFSLTELTAIEILAVRWPVAAVIFVILAKLKLIKVSFKDKPKKELIILVLFQPCLYSLFETLGTVQSTATECSVIIATVPLMVIVNSAIIFKQKNSLKTIIGIVVAFMGVLFCVVFTPEFSLGGKWMGYVSLMLAVLTGSIYSILTNRCGKFYSALEIAYAMTVSAGVWFFIISLIAGNGMHPYKVLFAGGTVTWSLMYLAILCSVIGYFIFNMSLVRMNPAIAACVNTNAINVVGVIGGILILDDPFGWYTVAGLILMIVGIVIATMKKE